MSELRFNFDTEGHYGLLFDDPLPRTIAEINLILPILEELDPELQLSRNDLAGYHLLHYGTDADTVNEAIDAILGAKGKASALNDKVVDVLPQILTEDRPTTIALPLGRVVLGPHTIVPSDVDDSLFGLEKCLYPRSGNTMTYLGRGPLRFYEDGQHPNGASMDNIVDYAVEPDRKLNTDTFHLIDEDQETGKYFAALSYGNNGCTELLKIKRIPVGEPIAIARI